MESFAGDPSLARLLEGVNTQMAAAFVSNLFDLGLHDKDLPVDTRFLRVLLDQIGEPPRAPGALSLAVGHALLLRRASRRTPATSSPRTRACSSSWWRRPKRDKGSFIGDQEAIETVRGAIAKLRPDFPTVQAGVTGGPALSNDEMTAAFHDSGIATVLAFALTLLVMTPRLQAGGQAAPHAGRARGDASRGRWASSR